MPTKSKKTTASRNKAAQKASKAKAKAKIKAAAKSAKSRARASKTRAKAAKGRSAAVSRARKRTSAGDNLSFAALGFNTVFGSLKGLILGVAAGLAWVASQTWKLLQGENARQPLGMVLSAISIFTFVALIDYDGTTNICGRIGNNLAEQLLVLVGMGAFLAPAFGVFWGVARLMRDEPSGAATVKLIGVLILTLTASLSAHALGNVEPTNTFPYGQGGWLGDLLYPPLMTSLGGFGVSLLLVLLGAVSSLLATEWAFVPLFQDLVRGARDKAQPDLPLTARKRSLREQAAESHERTVTGFDRFWSVIKTVFSSHHAKDDADMPVTLSGEQAGLPFSKEDAANEETAKERPEIAVEMAVSEPAEPAEPAVTPDPVKPRPEIKIEQPGHELTRPEVVAEPAVVIAQDAEVVEEGPRAPQPQPVLASLPPESILVIGKKRDQSKLMEEVKERGNQLQSVFEAFGLPANVIGAKRGPTLTLFEVQLDTGISVKKLKSQRDDIAVSLGVQEGVRIVYPLPGKTTVGVEVPNINRENVTLNDVYQGVEKRWSKIKLPAVLGRGTLGDAAVEDLTKMPHMLIAGTTGSGKSVCVNSILVSMLMTRKPDQLRLLLIDPKQVELQLYQDIPHLMCPVVTDMRRAAFVLNWAMREMDERLHVFQKAGVRNITDYNDLGVRKLKERVGEQYDPEDFPKSMPYVVIVIDELADLMIQARKEVEMAIARIAAKARAAGLHMLVATQRPSTDVVTGLIKTNMPVRMAFRVSSGIDSRVILDDSGAEVLLGNGDFLYRPPGSATLVRGQGCFVSEDEVREVCDHLRKNGKPEYLEELVAGPGAAGEGGPVDDPLFGDAVRIVLKSGRGSASLLQRALSVGYTRGSRLVDIMTEQGILGPHVGSKAREILMTVEQFEEAFPQYAEK